MDTGNGLDQVAVDNYETRLKIDLHLNLQDFISLSLNDYLYHVLYTKNEVQRYGP